MVILRIIARSELVTVRTHRRIMKELHREVLEKHIDETLPKHFQPEAMNVYHYKRRTLKYQKRKIRVKGHNRPNVWSGRTLREMRGLGSQIIADYSRARVQYTLHWQNVKNRRKASTLTQGGNTAERVKELEQINLNESYKYGVWMRQRYLEKINDPANRRKRMRRR